jgi:single-strand DNA-binding protein
MTNSTILIGRLTRPAVLKYNGDKARANFTIAVDGMNDKTDFIPIVCFGKLAENVAEYTDKGHLVSVEGRVSSGKYTNDADETVFTLDILANRVSFLAKPRTATTTPDSVDPETGHADESEAA